MGIGSLTAEGVYTVMKTPTKPIGDKEIIVTINLTQAQKKALKLIPSDWENQNLIGVSQSTLLALLCKGLVCRRPSESGSGFDFRTPPVEETYQN